MSDVDRDQRASRLLAEQRAAWARGDRRAALAARAVMLKIIRSAS